jgi:prepilin-type N-terminal cleavage/methylation domain-containing protein
MRRRNTGFTLAEFVMAMAIVAIIGAAVAGVATALSTAYAHSEDFYMDIQNGRMAMLRMQSTARKAKLVTACTPTTAVLWTGDTNGDGQINLSEISMLSYDAAGARLLEYRVVYPADMAPATRSALDVVVPLSTLTSVSATQDLLKTNVYVQTTVQADQVLDFRPGVKPAAPLSKIMTFDLKVGTSGNNLELRSACALRADATQYVSTSGPGVYVLNPIPTGK